MGLQPLDLQTMYSQISNVANKAAGMEQSLQAVQNTQQKESERLAEEQSKKVQESERQNGASSVNQNGHNSSAFSSGQKSKEKQNDSDEESESKKYRLKESYLGQHVDITR